MSILTQPYAALRGESVTGIIETSGEVHLAIGSSLEGLNKFEFQAGEVGSITAIADGGGGELKVTTTGHTLLAGEIIALVGGTGYDGLYEVQSVDVNDFYITGVYVATGTGTYIRGVNFKALTGSAGKYDVGGGFTGKCATGGATFMFYLVHNTTEILAFGRTFANSVDTGNSSSPGMYLEIAEGDIISFGFKNTTGTANIEQDVLNILLKRIAE